MPLDPGYGDPLLPFEELDALLPELRKSLPDPITKTAIYDLEQSIENEVAEELLTAVLNGDMGVETLLSDQFLRDLHGRLYRDIWTWGGQYRRYLFNIGIDWHLIPGEVRGALDTVRIRWIHNQDWTARELGIAAHADVVRIHPFPDGNGRATRLLADLVFVATQTSQDVEFYDWKINKSRYIELLRDYDRHRDPRALAAFIPTFTL